MTPEQIVELRSLLGSATDRGISPYARNTHHNKLADRLIWNGADGGDGDLHVLLDIAEAHARLRERLERLRPLSDEAAQAPWKATNDFDGSDWLVCSLGIAHDDKGWHVTTDGVRASELRGGPGEEAALIAAARNEIAAMLEDTKP